MEPLKDDSIAGTSDENLKIKEEVINNEYDFPEKVPTSWKDANKEERTFTVTFVESGKKHLVRGRLSDSLLSALKSSKHICEWMERNKTREFHLIEKKERLNVCVNLGMPLKYVSDGSQFEMKSYKLTKNENTNELWYRQYDDRKEECVVFRVCGTGSRMETHGAQSRRLIKKQSLLKEYCSFCIFAPKGESIKDALCNDGRFLPVLKEMNWTLVKDGKIIDNHFLVNNLADEVYEIEVESKKGARYSGDQNKWNDLDVGRGQQLSTLEKPQPRPDFEEGQLNASQKQQLEPDCEQGKLSTSKKQQLQDSECQILYLYPKLKEARQNIDTFLRGYKKDVLEVYKRNFGKEINDSLSFKLVRTLAKYGDSVGYIEWRDVIGCVQGSATCFVLHGRYILTCHHVIKLIVGEGTEAKDWGNRIKQSARVTFSYEEQPPTEKWFSLENWFEIADEDLDFAVLKLEENESKSHPPPGLLQLHFPPPPNGPIFIIGHPNGRIKSMDVCLVVSIFERGNEFSNHLHTRQNTKCSPLVCGYSQETKCIHMYNPKSFEGDRSNPNVVTYNTCFFEGSSGSPVFNKHGQLIALHAAGFTYKMRNKDCSIIECGYSIHSIILKIKSKFKSWYDAIIGPDAREDSSHVGALLSEAEEKMDCS
ncbi:serine protease FAM111A [Ahaetulla prasina]|uniref:serine protease FAM111A n=1 Tax=Ahaetulla prasina TaxID=499056 RepID=UPI002649CE85|nr:serine protease FAM111A [Ahaetulla prasina]XP_058053065.1 serine protease FAM111A [Ahaetulla prasina]